jgi:outer membrane protease
MKRTLILMLAFVALATSQTYAQEKQVVKKETRKEVQVKEDNGVKTLTIRTNENGNETVEVYQGAEADKKIAELEAQNGKASEVQEEVTVEEVNGQQVVRVKKTTDGQTTEEVKQTEMKDEQHTVRPESIKTKQIKRVELKRN